jgi:hypothetical protein
VIDSAQGKDLQMAEKKFLSWIGFKDQTDNSSSSGSSDLGSASTSGSASTGGPSTFERIRQLEAELADLRARRDITSLTEEEFEILATETATTLIKTAQAREARAVAAAERALAEGTRIAKQVTESAESKARSVLQSAEGRSRKYLEAAEAEAKEAIAKATHAAETLIDSKQREAATITSAAKREAERVIKEATDDIMNFKGWLLGAVEESERIQKVQHQALAAAEDGIRQARTRLSHAFERLSALGEDIQGSLDESHRPKDKEFTRSNTNTPSAPVESAKPTRSTAKKSAAKTGSSAKAKATPSARKSAGNPPKRK